jgi:hypothetical protein
VLILQNREVRGFHSSHAASVAPADNTGLGEGGGVEVHRSGAYVYAIHVNKWTELDLILVNANRKTPRLC